MCEIKEWIFFTIGECFREGFGLGVFGGIDVVIEYRNLYGGVFIG